MINLRSFLWQTKKKTYKQTERGIVGGSGRAYNLPRPICTVSSSGTFESNELTSKEHIKKLRSIVIFTLLRL